MLVIQYVTSQDISDISSSTELWTKTTWVYEM